MLNAVIDVSHHQTDIDFARVKAAGVVGVIHKATAGTHFIDSLYATHRNRALEAGLLFGAYHWGTGDASGADQADHFLSVVRPDDKTLLALDYEPNVAGGHRLGPDMDESRAAEFVTMVRPRSYSFPLLYTGGAMKGHWPNLPQCPLWWAQYGPAPSGIPTNIWPTWTLWQYTGDGIGPRPHSVDGIAGAIDRDQFNGSLEGLLRLWNVPVS
jgi:lysozyme